MLPITSASDTYRAGIWAFRQNLGVIGLWMILDGGHEAAQQYRYSLLLSGEMDIGSAIELFWVYLLTSIAVKVLLIALLVVALHATLLSDGRVAGFRALADGALVCRVAWRLFLIGFAVLLPLTLVPKIADLLQAGGLWEESLHAVWRGDAGPLWQNVYLAGQSMIYFLAVILLGLGVPRAVALGRAGPLGGSIRWGARLFRPMAVRLLVGPGLVFAVHEFIQQTVIAVAPDSFSRVPLPAIEIASGFVALVATAFSAAMIAAILSDGFRRAVASAPQPAQS